jgi:hypothetical protein
LATPCSCGCAAGGSGDVWARPGGEARGGREGSLTPVQPAPCTLLAGGATDCGIAGVSGGQGGVYAATPAAAAEWRCPR